LLGQVFRAASSLYVFLEKSLNLVWIFHSPKSARELSAGPKATHNPNKMKSTVKNVKGAGAPVVGMAEIIRRAKIS
jgi:hypothetical protein